MHKGNWRVAIISACLFVLAHWNPCYFFWLSFFFLIPLYIRIGYCAQPLPLTAGFLWGLIFFGGHSLGLAQVLFMHARWNAALAVWLLIVLYFSSSAVCWFWGARVLGALFGTSRNVRLQAWVVATCFYFFVLDSYSLRCIGLLRGYGFIHPCIPLARYPCLLFLLTYGVSQTMLTLLLAGASAVSAWALITGGIQRGILLMIVAYAPFWVGLCLHQERYEDNVLGASLIYVSPSYSLKEIANEYAGACAVNEWLTKCTTQPTFKELSCLCMPESAYPFSLSHDSLALSLWHTHALQSSSRTALLLGAYRQEGDCFYNSCYYIKEGRITFSYDKKILFPFVEYIPSGWLSSYLATLFFKEKRNFSSNNKSPRPSIEIASGVIGVPYICSDLFFGYPDPDDEKQYSIFWLVHDGWFTTAYFRDLLFLFARLQAMIYQRSIIYIGYEKGWLLLLDGTALPLSMS